MNAREEGFLLLTGFLGDPERHPLTVAQFRSLACRARLMEHPRADRELTEQDLMTIGCDRGSAMRIVNLLSQKEQLQWYIEKGRRAGCVPVTRVSEGYPERVRKGLGLDAPGVLWAKGDTELLKLPAVALVGSRDLFSANREFAQLVGKQAALQGFALVSGHARGADRTAQESCLENGGKVISVVADGLETHPLGESVLYLSEDGFDLPFSAHRALQRNRVIHCLGSRTFVAQCSFGKGGTWDGTRKNLRFGWSPVFCFDDGSPASRELEQLGAVLIRGGELQAIETLRNNLMNFIDQ